MRRPVLLLVLTIIATSCSLIGTGDQTTRSTQATADSTAGTDTPSTASSATIAPGSGDCTGAPSEIVLLCQAIDLIQHSYVDDVSDADLVSSGIEGVSLFDHGGELGDLDCSVSDPVAEPICVAIDGADITPEQGVEAALMAMALDLDPNSVYLDPEALRLSEDDTSGRVEGIGALVNAEDTAASDPVEAQCSVMSQSCRLVVVSTFDDSPAERAGVLPGDAIVSVDGRDVEGLHVDEVTALVRGPAGTDVRVGFDRDGSVVEVEITRDSIDIPVATWEMVGDIGYIRLNMFTANAGDQIQIAVDELLGAGAVGLVLDLRDNPGGALTASIDVVSQFLGEGLAVITESPEDVTEYEVSGDGLATSRDLPLWIVMNRGSASASEVTAGVLSESGRATTLGENTFGKNTVQQRFPLGNGGAMKLTVARWTTPSGTDFGAVGIAPDIVAEFPVEMTAREVTEKVLALDPHGLGG